MPSSALPRQRAIAVLLAAAIGVSGCLPTDYDLKSREDLLVCASERASAMALSAVLDGNYFNAMARLERLSKSKDCTLTNIGVSTLNQAITVELIDLNDHTVRRVKTGRGSGWNDLKRGDSLYFNLVNVSGSRKFGWETLEPLVMETRTRNGLASALHEMFSE